MRLVRLSITLISFSSVLAVPHRNRHDHGARVINGVPVAHQKYPFMVSIEYLDSTLADWFTTCGGTIVNRVTILTACHCATKDERIHGSRKDLANPVERRVVAGSAYWEEHIPSKTRQIAHVKRIVTHRKCQNYPDLDRPFVNDVALYFLEGPLVYTVEVRPMKVPSTNAVSAVRFTEDLIAEGAWCTTIGWGRTQGNDPTQSSKLMAAQVQLLRPGECRKRFCAMTFEHCNTQFELFDQICVASPTASDCFGDSGGPLICKGVVVGSVSYGEAPCPATLPTVFQNLRPILELLSNNNVQIDNAQIDNVQIDNDYGFPEKSNAIPPNDAINTTKVRRKYEASILNELRRIRGLLSMLVDRPIYGDRKN